MTPFFEDLERQLHTAARARSGGAESPVPPAPGRRGWLRSGARAVPALAAVAVTVLVAGVALLALGHGSHHASPPAAGLANTPAPELRQEFAYIQKATRHVIQSRECQAHPPMGTTLIHGSPSPAILSTLGVLRRPARPSDHLAQGSLSGLGQVYAGFVRRAFSAGGVSYYVIATRDSFAAQQPPARCFAAQTEAVQAYAPRIPANLRRQTLALEATIMSYVRGLIAHAPRDAICTAEFSRNGSGGSGCGDPIQQIRMGLPPSDDNGTFSGIVPDGVATVTVHFAATAGHPAISATAKVTGNMYAVRIPELANGTMEQPTMTWRSPTGLVRGPARATAAATPSRASW
jgi:hypothetical protein